MKSHKKNRWSDYCPDQVSNVVDLNPAEIPLKLVFEAPGERPQSLDLSFMKGRPQLASLFARTIKSEGQRYAKRSRGGMRTAVRNFYKFIELKRPEINCALELTYELLQDWGAWMINVEKFTVDSAANRFSRVRVILYAAKSHYPDEFRPDFDMPLYVFTRIRRRENSPRALNEEVIQQLTRAAEKEVNEIRLKYREGDVPHSLQDLIPFLIIFGIRTAANSESIYHLRRDCLKPHPIDTNAYYVEWIKRRSRAGVQRQLHRTDARGNGIIELIQFLRAYTQPLVDQAQEPDQEMMFLYLSSFGGTTRVIAARRSDRINETLRAFCQRNGVPDMNMSQLRPSAATHHYRKSGGKLRKVQLLLGHVDMSTTERYIGAPLVESFHNSSIRTAQRVLVERVTTVIPKKAENALADLPGDFSPEQIEHIADGEYDTGICKCRNPFDSPQPGQQKGKCCTLFLACLTCPNALFFLDELPRVIALRNHLLKEKENMRRGVWDVLYRDKLATIESDIIGAFSEAQVSEAERLAAEITDMPILTAREVLK